MTQRRGIGFSWAWAGVLALSLAALAWAFWPRPLPVEAAVVQRGRFEQTIREDGRIRAVQRYVISAPTAGELVRPTLKVGDAVVADQVVATLMPAAPQMIDPRTRAVLQERVGSAQAAWQSAQAQMGQAQAALERARLEAERAVLLAQENFISAAAREQAELLQRSQAQALQAAQAQVRVAEHARAEARAALLRADSGAREGAWALRAPVPGRVTRLYLESATTVPVGQPLLEIADMSHLEAVVDVLSGDALRIEPGTPVRLSLGGSLPELAASVARIEPVAYTKVSALGIEEQRVNVIVDVDNLNAHVPAVGEGFRVDATLVVEQQDDALIVPAAALVRDGPGWSVFIVEEGRARSRAVDVVERNPDIAWLASGVSAGASVVLYPGPGLVEGQRVRVASTGAAASRRGS